ncbi:ligase-associated DNA damage response endonuclease PdeM [Maribacter hydrothermalis]|uniref:Metallophosphoesterase n=1 Tax=Maribacter hydrothermalis TaxID=1836467 RepID=A0A1B7Z198_9FLAO|nr:ligase-associated DNA damage response endonuclease PdeM [Maribacter hydrothermalis]APQ18150.1 metallophosphoesterase [Maribacter hydrothermalis]OBR36497.1 metallophosphoesterase [Maribacter hydrothermalis]
MNIEFLKINNQSFTMHPHGVLFWQEKSILLISDVHLGKVSHFRKFGAAVPQKAVQKNFDLLDEVIAYFKPEVIVFMGDLFHSSLNKEWKIFEKWTSNITSKIILVVGNHDIISPVKYKELGIEVVPEIQLDSFLLTHHPEEKKGFFNICGHIHPAVRLKGIGKQSMRLRCFYKTDGQLLLPAFGEFTGSHTISPVKNCQIFALLDNTVFPITVKS